MVWHKWTSTKKGVDDMLWVWERCMGECVMMKVWKIQWSATEVADAWLEQWFCQFTVEGLKRKRRNHGNNTHLIDASHWNQIQLSMKCSKGKECSFGFLMASSNKLGNFGGWLFWLQEDKMMELVRLHMLVLGGLALMHSEADGSYFPVYKQLTKLQPEG